jgi:uncharacterized protein YceK
MKVNYMVRLVLFWVLIFFTTGCMSLSYRLGEDDFDIGPGPYPGLRTTAEIVDQSFQNAESAGMIYGMWFYWVPDIPLSFCLDTICLPYDFACQTDNDADEEIKQN